MAQDYKTQLSHNWLKGTEALFSNLFMISNEQTLDVNMFWLNKILHSFKKKIIAYSYSQRQINSKNLTTTEYRLYSDEAFAGQVQRVDETVWFRKLSESCVASKVSKTTNKRFVKLVFC